MLFLLCIVFGLYVMIREFKKVIAQTNFRIINVFGIMYGLTYGFLPAYFVYCNDNNMLKENFMLHDEYLWLWFSLSVFCYILIQIVYYYNNTNLNKSVVYPFKGNIRTFQIFSILCFVIGIFSMYMWTKAHGGIGNFILVANAVRGGWDNTVNEVAFFKHPAKLVVITTFFFLKLVMVGYKRNLNILLLIISLSAAILYLLANDGRLPFIMFFCVLFLIYIKFFDKGYVNKKKILIISVSALIAIILINYMDLITSYIRTGQYEDSKIKSADGFINTEFSYIIKSGISSSMQFMNGECPYYLLEDLKSAFFAWFPTSLKPDNLINLWSYNTMLIHGDFYYGQLPTDFISASIYNGGIFGFIFYALLWGSIIRYVDNLHIGKMSMFTYVIYYYMIEFFLRLPEYSMFYSHVLYFFAVFVSFVIWKFCKMLFR